MKAPVGQEDGAGEGGRAASTQQLLGTPEQREKVQMGVVPLVRIAKPQSLLAAEVERGGVISTDQCKGSNGLGAWRFRLERIDKSTRLAHGRFSINGMKRFWFSASEQLPQFHSTLPSSFPLHRKNLQCGYNYRSKCFEVVV